MSVYRNLWRRVTQTTLTARQVVDKRSINHWRHKNSVRCLGEDETDEAKFFRRFRTCFELLPHFFITLPIWPMTHIEFHERSFEITLIPYRNFFWLQTCHKQVTLIVAKLYISQCFAFCNRNHAFCFKEKNSEKIARAVFPRNMYETRLIGYFKLCR